MKLYVLSLSMSRSPSFFIHQIYFCKLKFRHKASNNEKVENDYNFYSCGSFITFKHLCSPHSLLQVMTRCNSHVTLVPTSFAETKYTLLIAVSMSVTLSSWERKFTAVSRCCFLKSSTVSGSSSIISGSCAVRSQRLMRMKMFGRDRR